MTPPYVTGRPRVFLRLDGAVLFVPHLFMAGHARSTKVGALIYNLGHTYTLPAVTAFAGWYTNHFLVLAIGLIWLAHVGMDRFAGYGFKYDDDFKHAHLGSLYKNSDSER
jgi:hypothetical protein